MHAWWGDVPSLEKCPIKFNKIIRQTAKYMAAAEHTTHAAPKTWSSFFVPRMFIYYYSQRLCKERFVGHKIAKWPVNWVDVRESNDRFTHFHSIYCTQRGNPTHRRKCFLFLDALVYVWALRNLIWRIAHLSHTLTHETPLKRKIYSLTCAYGNLLLKSTCNVDVFIPFLQSALCVRASNVWMKNKKTT